MNKKNDELYKILKCLLFTAQHCACLEALKTREPFTSRQKCESGEEQKRDLIFLKGPKEDF